jgi:hypothetical protein
MEPPGNIHQDVEKYGCNLLIKVSDLCHWGRCARRRVQTAGTAARATLVESIRLG